MTDYQPLIARAVEGLDRSTGEARRALYERARTALVTQLRAVEPALSESDITKERLALEEAIRKVEVEAARKLRTEPRPQSRLEPRERRPAAPPPRDRSGPPAHEPPREAARGDGRAAEPSWPPQHGDEPAAAAAAAAAPPRPALTARERLLSSRNQPLAQEGLKGFRDVVSEAHNLGAATAKAAQFARNARDSYGSAPAPAPAQHAAHPPPPADETAESSAHDDFEPVDAEELDSAHYDARHVSRHDSRSLRSLEPSYALEDEEPVAPHAARPQPPHAAAAEAEFEELRPPRSYRGLIKLAVVAIILLGVTATLSWQWSNITGVYHFFARSGPRSSAQTTQEAPAQPKFSGRVPQEQNPGQAPGAAAPGSQTVPAAAVAQRVVLYEEDPANPQGKRYVGSAIWRTETVSPGPGLAPELAIRADVTIPERRMTMTWSLRRNTDKTLPASHTIEIMFNLPADFPGGGIGNVPGILMKEAEQARGTPLAGLAVKVTNNYFLIGLSAADTDMQRNIQLLKDRGWFDIPIVYSNGGRAILAMEKGPPGDRAFAEAFAAWEKK